MRKFKFIGLILLGLGLLIGLIFFTLGILRPKVAGVHIETNPASSVFVNGEQVGRTPYEATRAPGEVIIKLVPESFQVPLSPYETKVNLVPGVQTVIKREFGEVEDTSTGEIISFEKIGKNDTSLAVVTIPDAAQLIIDGRERSFTPHKTSSILPGEHTLTISAKGYLDRLVEVKTHQGYQLTAVVKLAKSPEQQKVEEPPQAEVLPEEIEKEEIEITFTPTGFLRVRQEPSTLANEVAQVKPGERYPLLETDEKTGWYKIEYLPPKAGEEGKVGWITNQYAKKVQADVSEKNVTLTPTTSPKPTPKVSGF